MSANNADFQGFSAPNTTPVPDQLFDELLTRLSGGELKVLLYIIRRTFGFKKAQDSISLNQMLHGIQRQDGSVLDSGVGLSKPTLLSALRSLEEQGIILRVRRSDDKRGDLPTAYSLRMADAVPTREEPQEEGGGQKTLPRGGKESLPPPGQKTLPPTRNSLTKIHNNVDGDRRKNWTKPKAHVDFLVSEIEKQTGDTHSRGSFARIADALPEHRLFELLSEMKQDGKVRNKGAWFTAMAHSELDKSPP
ncbi:MAG: replication protein [Anaerolineae bacterium]|nr:replication protein [Anaerolineae bacterium]